MGQGIRDSGIDRAELFITSKFNRQWHSVDGVRQAYQASLERLGLDYLDLLAGPLAQSRTRTATSRRSRD